MHERPILFSSQMVNAILREVDPKTQTRRLIKLQPEHGAVVTPHGDGFLVEHWPKCERMMMNFGRCENIVCPYGRPGDRLWVRETFCIGYEHTKGQYTALPFSGCEEFRRALYRADGGDPPDEPQRYWKPSIFMPRWASRITLEITEVRVQRLQDISEEDAIAEGMRTAAGDERGGHKWEGIGYEGGKPGYFHVSDYDAKRCRCKLGGPTPAQCAYHDLWDSINAKRTPWSSNPFVWCVSFRRLQNG